MAADTERVGSAGQANRRWTPTPRPARAWVPEEAPPVLRPWQQDGLVRDPLEPRMVGRRYRRDGWMEK